MTAIAIYDDRLEVSFAPLWAFLATVMGAITGFFMSSDDSYLSDDERAALAEGSGEEETDDGGNNDDDDGNDQGGNDEDSGDAGGNENGDEPDGQRDTDSADAVAQANQAPIKDPKAGISDPGDNEGQKDEPQASPADAGTSGTDSGTIDFDAIYDERMAELEKLLDDGKVPYDEYDNRKRQIERDIRKLEREHNLAQMEAVAKSVAQKTKLAEAWYNDQEVFFAANPNLSAANAHPIVYKAFSEEVARLGAMPEWKLKPGADLLTEAKKNIDAAFGLQTAAKQGRTEGQKAVDKAKQVNAAQAAPKTLKTVPAGEENKDNSFDYLDHLSGADYQKAIKKMSPAEKEIYEKTLQ